jgi:hypothetical protein
MKTEHLEKASDHLDLFLNELRKAHSEAVDSGDGFAEIVIFGLLEEFTPLERKFRRAKLASENWGQQ